MTAREIGIDMRRHHPHTDSCLAAARFG